MRPLIPRLRLCRGVAAPFARPWWGQRRALPRERRGPTYLLGVCGRQSGKSHFGAWLLLRRAAAAPGGTSCVLVPTWRIGLAPVARLRELAAPLGAVWHEQKQLLDLRNGHKIWIRSADKPDATRGLTIDATLWIDEAAYVSEDAWTAAQACLATARAPLYLITTTPAGRDNWVYRLWTSSSGDVVRFTFRSADSPFVNEELAARLRETMGASRAAQELDAIFTDDKTTPFKPNDVSRLLSQAIVKVRGEQRSIGIDLAKEKDWTVATLMNELGEAWILGRWRHASWPDTEARLTRLLEEHKALAVVDVGHGGGYGGAIKDYLERSIGKARLLEVRTGNVGVKAEVIEALAADVEHGRLRVDNGGPHASDLRHELLFFTSTRRVVGGVERIVYEGPQGEDEHDDTVISLALANWGRIHGWIHPDPLKGDFSGFFKPVEAPTTPLPRHSFGSRIDLGWVF